MEELVTQYIDLLMLIDLRMSELRMILEQTNGFRLKTWQPKLILLSAVAERVAALEMRFRTPTVEIVNQVETPAWYVEAEIAADAKRPWRMIPAIERLSSSLLAPNTVTLTPELIQEILENCVQSPLSAPALLSECNDLALPLTKMVCGSKPKKSLQGVGEEIMSRIIKVIPSSSPRADSNPGTVGSAHQSIIAMSEDIFEPEALLYEARE